MEGSLGFAHDTVALLSLATMGSVILGIAGIAGWLPGVGRPPGLLRKNACPPKYISPMTSALVPAGDEAAASGVEDKSVLLAHSV